MTLIEGKFRIITRDRFPIKSYEPGRTLHHIATITSGLRDFVLILDPTMNECWLNELSTTGFVSEIEDSELFKELWKFLYDEGFLTVNASETKL